MSYILDAIKKSEAERNQGLAPGALAAAGPSLTHRTSPGVIGVIVALNIAAVATWFWWQSQPSPHAVAPPTRGEAPFQVSAPDTMPALPTPAPASAPPSTSATAAAAAAAAAPERAPANETSRVKSPTFEPSNVADPTSRRPQPVSGSLAVTPMVAPEFSTHVFADDADFRSVTLNGRRLKEGDLIEPGMRLVSITETGVVVDYHGERFELDVLQDWRD